MDAQRPLCFVVMPFGTKPDPAGRPDIDFDRVYERAIKPGIEAAGMEPIRADEERTGGIIHKPMFERLMLCDYAVADLTTANPNVLYELGVRHTARPSTTLSIFAQGQPMPFDVNFLRSLPYDLGKDNRFGDAEAEALRAAVTGKLEQLRKSAVEDDAIDSPLFQLIGDWKPDLSRLKTDLFRDQVRLNEELKERLRRARAKGRDGGVEAIDAIRDELGALDAYEAGVLVDLLLSYRAVEAWERMIALYEALPETLKRQILVREQLAFALNRTAAQKGDQPADEAKRARAIELLEGVVEQQGPSAETCGLIGRIHKDRWDESRKDNEYLAAGHLDEAIDAYRRGYEADPRDAYPGINLVTLLDVRGGDESLEERDRLLPVVRYAVERRLGPQADYWDHATLLELAVLANDPGDARKRLGKALAKKREVWEPKTTARNLRLLEEHRAARGEDVGWLGDVIAALDQAAK